MKWNAFGLTEEAINKTGKRLFPFRFGEWFKLGIISLLAADRTGGFNGGSNVSGGGGGGGGGIEDGSLENVANQVRQFIRDYWVFGAIIFSFVFVIGTIFSFIQSVFTFIFLESLVEKKAKFTFGKNSSKGFSLFLFKFLITLITLLVIGGLAFPYVYNFMLGNPVVSSVGIPFIVFSIIALVLYLFILWVIFLFLYDFAVPYTYVKGTTVRFSLGKVWKNIKENPLETLVYWVARLVFTLCVALISFFIVILVGLVFLVVGGLIFALGYLLYQLVGNYLLFIILAVIVVIILFMVFLLALGMCLLPFTVFLRYFELLNFEKLTKLKLFKSTKRRG